MSALPTTPYLSIGIPTWNRVDWLKNNIAHLIKEIADSQLVNVEIFVADNASDDETQQICQEFAKHCSYFTYFRQVENVGANLNFQTVLERAQGKYIWLLGDDDLIADQSISQVLAALIHYEPTIVVGGAIDEDTFEKATHKQYDQTVVSNRELLYNESLIELAGKISGLIIEKTAFLSIREQARAIIVETKTPWPHLVWVILLLNDPQRRIVVLSAGINLLLTAGWHNTLFSAADLIQIHFIALQDLILGIKSSVDAVYFNRLMRRTVTGRISILVKCVFYATFESPKSAALSKSLNFLPKLKGFKNKVSFSLFLIIPLCVPVILRKWGFELLAKIPLLSFNKLRITMGRLKQATLIRKNATSARSEFDVQQL